MTEIYKSDDDIIYEIFMILVERAKIKKTLFYKELSNLLKQKNIDIVPKKLGPYLEKLHQKLIELSGDQKLSSICVLVVNIQTEMPGYNFWIHVAKLCKSKSDYDGMLERNDLKAHFDKILVDVFNYPWEKYLTIP